MLRRFSHIKIKAPKRNFALYAKPIAYVSNFTEFAEQTFHEQTRKIEEENRLRTITENLYKLYEFHEKSAAAKKYLEITYLKTILNAKTPLKDILEYYQAKNKYGFDEELLSMTVENLAKAFQIIDPVKASEDFNVYDLHESFRFNDMIEEIKYGLKEGVLFDFEHISKIFKNLIGLEYKDLDLQQLAFEKISKAIKGEKESFTIDFKDPFKNYQCFKKYYYGDQLEVDEILNNPEFGKKLNEFINLERDPEDENLKQTDFSKNKDILNALLQNLKKMVETQETNFGKIIHAIMGVRSQYYQMKKLRNEGVLIKNANVQAFFLELEEQLLNVRLINIGDIKNPSDYQIEEATELKVVSKIFEEFIQENFPEGGNFIPLILDQRNLEKNKNKETLEKIEIANFVQRNDALKLDEISQTLLYLSEVTKIPYNESKKRDFIDNKWKNLFKQNYESFEMPLEFRNIMAENSWNPREFKCDRLLSPIYLNSLKAFKDLFPQIQKIVTKDSSLKQLFYLAYAYANMGLDEKSTYFFQMISEENLLQLADLNEKEFYEFCEAIMNVYVTNPAIKVPLLKYIENNCSNFSMETSVLALLALANYELKCSEQCITHLLKNVIDTLQGEKNSSRRLPSPLSSNIFDLKMVIESGILAVPPEIQGLIYESLRDFAGFNKIELLGENFPSKNPFVNDFLKLIELNTKNENIYQELMGFDFAKNGANYTPQLFTRVKTKESGLSRRAIFIFDSNHTSLEKQSVKEKWKMRFKIIEKLFNNVKCNGIPSNLLYKIDEEKQQVQIKNEDELNEIASFIIKMGEESDSLHNVKKFANIVPKFYEKNKTLFNTAKDSAAIIKIISYMSEIFETSQKMSFIPFETLTKYYFEKNKYLIYLIWRAAKILDDAIKKKLLSSINKEFSMTFPSLHKFFIFLAANFSDSHIHSNNQHNVQEILKENPWIGKRLTNELILDSQDLNIAKNINYELLDLGFYNDHSYHNYPEWKKRFEDLSINNLCFIQPEVFSNLLYSSHNGIKQTQVLSLLPKADKLKNIIKPMSVKLNWEPNIFNKSEEHTEKLKTFDALAQTIQPTVSNETQFFINLQNFKYILKKEKTVDEVGAFLVDFQFIEDLIDEHLNENQMAKGEVFTKTTSRNGKDFTKYFNHPLRGAFINDYTKFMMKIALKKEKFRQFVKMRNDLEQYKKFKGDSKSLWRLKNFKETIDKEIRNEIRKMDEESNEKPILTSQSKKYLDYEYNIEEIMKNINLNPFKKEHDLDFIKCNGDYDEFLIKEKRKAETKLIKLRIIKKIHENIALTPKEKTYLNKWVTSSLPKKHKETTKRSLNSLSKQDKDLIQKTNYFTIDSYGAYPLNDFIFEFSQFFDDRFLEYIDWKLKSKEIKEQWNIDFEVLMPFYQNKETNYLLHHYENYLFNDAGKLNHEDIDLVSEMTKILKTHSKSDRKESEYFDNSMKNFINLANPFPKRFSLISKWMSEKKQEIEIGINDIEIGKDEHILKLWQSLFQKPYEETTSKELHIFIHNLVERFYIIKKYPPPSMNSLLKHILEHNNLSTVDKETLLAFLEFFKIDLKVNSQEIENYLKKNNVSEINEATILGRVKQSSLPFMENLISKMQNIA